MFFPAALKDSMARGLDAAFSFIQHCVMVVALLCTLGIVAFVIDGSNAANEKQEVASTPDVALVSFPPASLTIDDKPPPTKIGPQSVKVLNYIKKRYRVSPDAILPVFEMAEEVGKERSIDPLLILAIIGVESGFNPFAESSMGARGLMQVIPRFHMDKLPEGAGSQQLFDPAVNIRVGVTVLEEAMRRRGGLVAGLQSYSGSSSAEGSYSNKVLAEKARLEKAAQTARRETEKVNTASNA